MSKVCFFGIETLTFVVPATLLFQSEAYLPDMAKLCFFDIEFMVFGRKRYADKSFLL